MNKEIKERINMIDRGEVPEGYKKTRIGVVPEDWEVKKALDTFELLGGFAFKSTDATDQGVRWLKIANVDIGSAKWETIDYLPVDYMDDYKRYLLRKNDTVMALTRPILNGRLKIAKLKDADVPALLNQRVGKIEVKNNSVDEYVYYYLSKSSTVNKLESLIAGTDPPNLGKNELRRLNILYPPLKEQQKIAQILSTWDKSIELKENLIEEKKQQKKGLMQRLLTGEVRLPGFEGEWEKVRLKDLLKVIRRKIEWDDNQKYDLVSIRRRYQGLFYRESLYGYQIRTKNLRPIEEGDFLISRMQIVHGALGMATKKFRGMFVSNSYIILRSKNERKLNIQFFDYLTKLPFMYHVAYRSSYGVHIEKMTFNLQLYLEEKIYIPKEIQEQKTIAQVLSTADKEIDLLTKELEQLKEQKKGLMQLLLTGKIRVPLQ